MKEGTKHILAIGAVTTAVGTIWMATAMGVVSQYEEPERDAPVASVVVFFVGVFFMAGAAPLFERWGGSRKPPADDADEG